jgi:hypothetical protein
MSRRDKVETFWWVLILVVFVVLAFAGLIPNAAGFGGFLLGLLFASILWGIGYLLAQVTLHAMEHLEERRRSYGRRTVGSDRGEEGS